MNFREAKDKGEDNVNSSSTAKTILFWISIVFLGVMLWKLVSANGSQAREQTPSYTEFMAKVDAGDIKEVTLYLSPNSYEVQGEYLRPAEHEICRDGFQGSGSGSCQATKRQGSNDQGDEGGSQRGLDFDPAERGASDLACGLSVCS